jgi:Glycosyl transferases group 1
VHFVGVLPYEQFIELMRVTRVHAYLSYPFVLSWSMLEAMSAGALVVASCTPPVQEVIQDGINGRLVGFFDIDAWSDALINGLAEPERYHDIRVEPRRTIIESYDLRTNCLPRQIELSRGQRFSSVQKIGFRAWMPNSRIFNLTLRFSSIRIPALNPNESSPGSAGEASKLLILERR